MRQVKKEPKKELNMEKKLLLIVNPVAGKKLAQKQLAELVRVFMEGGWLPTVLLTARAGEATELTARYGGDYERIVCAGGDGTLNEVTTGLVCAGLDKPVGYLPCGSTNDLAGFLKIPAELMQAAELAATGEPKAIDVGDFNGRYFVNMSEFGAFSWLPYSTPQYLKNVLGYFAYVLDGIKDLSKIRSSHLRLTAGERVYEGDFIFGAVCSAAAMGGVFDLPSGAVQADDGLFEILLIHSPESAIALQEIILALQTQNYEDPHIEFFRAPSLSVETEDPFDWAMDGERVEGRPLNVIQNMPHRLRLIY